MNSVNSVMFDFKMIAKLLSIFHAIGRPNFSAWKKKNQLNVEKVIPLTFQMADANHVQFMIVDNRNLLGCEAH